MNIDIPNSERNIIITALKEQKNKLVVNQIKDKQSKKYMSEISKINNLIIKLNAHRR